MSSPAKNPAGPLAGLAGFLENAGFEPCEGPSVKKTSRWDVFSEERRDGPHTLACGSSSQQRFVETLVDPASPATSEQSPLCDHVFFCLRHKKPPGASLPCSSSPQKVTLRLRCSLVNALTTLWLATNFLRKRAARAWPFLFPSVPRFCPSVIPAQPKIGRRCKVSAEFLLLHYSRFTLHCLAGPIFGRE